jgi:hypothetical protein
MLHKETGQEAYRQVALGAIDWLNRLDISKAEHISFAEAAPAVIMYVLEAYSTAMPYLESGSPREKGALAQWAFVLKWMAENQASRGTAARWDYQSQWGSKLGGFPFHMLIYAGQSPDRSAVAAAADAELGYLAKAIPESKKPGLSQLTVFALMSYAERVQPGAIYRKSKP